MIQLIYSCCRFLLFIFYFWFAFILILFTSYIVYELLCSRVISLLNFRVCPFHILCDKFLIVNFHPPCSKESFTAVLKRDSWHQLTMANYEFSEAETASLFFWFAHFMWKLMFVYLPAMWSMWMFLVLNLLVSFILSRLFFMKIKMKITWWRHRQ